MNDYELGAARLMGEIGEGEIRRMDGDTFVQIKDLVVGAKLAAGISGHEEYKEARPGQITVAEGDLVAAVRGILDAQKAEREA